MSDITDAAAQLTLAAKNANNTTNFFDDVITLGDSETVTNPNNGITVPSVQKQIKDLYDGSETDLNLAVAASESARDESVEAKDETQALFDDFDNSVAESLSVVSGIDWDVEIYFNDGLEIKKGYGNRDVYGNKSVDFSRASATGNINKSGVLETVPSDEPSVTTEGLSCYESYTNYFDTPTSPVTQDIILSSGSYTLIVHEGGGTASTAYGDATYGEYLTFSSSGETLSVEITGDVTVCNLINLSQYAPPLLGDSTSSRSGDFSSVPCMNNMPKPGNPFTILVEISNVNEVLGYLFFLIGLRIQCQGRIYRIHVSDGDNTEVLFTNVATTNTSEKVVLVYTGTELLFYLNGDFKTNLTPTIVDVSRLYWDVSEEIYIGSSANSRHINGSIKEFKIKFSALSSDKIKSLGGAS